MYKSVREQYIRKCTRLNSYEAPLSFKPTIMRNKLCVFSVLNNLKYKSRISTEIKIYNIIISYEM
jgi:hypothetical protein